MSMKAAIFDCGVELVMSEDQANAAYHQGQCDDDVNALAQEPDIARQLDKIGHDAMVKELREFGAWSEAELANRQDTRERFLWIAAGNIVNGQGVDA